MHKLIRRLSAGLGLVCVLAFVAHAQQPAPPQSGTGLLIGRVIDQDDRPLAGAIVTLSGAGPADVRVMVDSQGRFIYRGVPRGRVTLLAELPGYLSGAYGKTRADGTARTLDVADNQRVIDLTIRLWKFASISGRVLDEAGEPITGASVMAFMNYPSAGRQTRINRGSIVPTDDRGVYRITDLAPGNYVVSVPSQSITFPATFVSNVAAARAAGPAAQTQLTRSLATTGASQFGLDPTMASQRFGDFVYANQFRASVVPDASGRLELYPFTFFPSATSPDSATAIEINAGEDRSGVDVQLRPVRGARVSGVVTGPNGPIANIGLRLQLANTPTFRNASNLEVGQTVTTGDGTFTFLGIPPGEYVLWGMTLPAPGSTDNALWTSASFAVGDADLKNMSLGLKPALRVSGRIVWEGAAPPPPAARLAALPITLEAPDGRSTGPLLTRARGVAVGADGSFVIDSALPGKYYLRLPLPPPGWSLKSAVVDGHDVSTDQPLTLDTSDVTGVVITFTDQPISVAGTAHTAQGIVDGASNVVLFPVNPQQWTDYGATPRAIRSVPTGRDGAFAIVNVPAGDYFIASVPDAAGNAWQDSAFLQRLARIATRVHVDRDQTIDLATVEIR